MKKRLTFAIVLVSLILPFALFAQENASPIKVQIFLSGNIGYAHNGGMDKFVSGWGDYYADNLNQFLIDNSISPADFKGKEETAKFAYGGEAELRFFYNTFGFGISGGIIGNMASSKLKSKSWSDKAKYSVNSITMPLLTTFYYEIPVGSSHIAFGGGLGYYMKPSITVEFENDVSVWSQADYDYKFKGKSSLGYHAKIEWNMKISSSIIMNAGILGRYVTITDYKNSTLGVLQEADSTKKFTSNLSGIMVYFGIGFSI